MTNLTQGLQQIVDPGKAATKRPWTTAPYRFSNGQGYIARVDVDYLAAAANSADILAQRLLDIGKLPDDATMKDVRKILDRR